MLSKRGTAQPWQPSQSLCEAPHTHRCHPGIPWLSPSLPLPWQREHFPSVRGSPHLHGQGCRCLGNQGQKSGRQMSLLQEDTSSEALGGGREPVSPRPEAGTQPAVLKVLDCISGSWEQALLWVRCFPSGTTRPPETAGCAFGHAPHPCQPTRGSTPLGEQSFWGHLPHP